jgi:3'-5' exoribonuclease
MRGAVLAAVEASVRTSVAELRAGTEVEGVFACTRKERLTARNGSGYLSIELRDRTGTIAARAFREADFLAGQFERGELVQVSGRVERFRGELQLELREIRRADASGLDPADFLPSAYRNLDELDGFLEHLAREVYDQHYNLLIAELLGDEELRAQLRRSPCTRSGHHAYLGGLLEHTVAVATLAQETCILHPRLNPDLLITAAIVHDIGKTREFDLGAEIALSEEGRLVGHVVLGERMVTARAAALDPGFPPDKLLALSHCILTHHGPDGVPGRRFGSPEALALYRLNALDAGVKGALEQGLAA